jgi:FdhD protein
MAVMNDTPEFGTSIIYKIIRHDKGRSFEEEVPVAAEIPCTFVVNDVEMATMMCTPSHLKEYTYGFLYTSGLIQSVADIIHYSCNDIKWRIDVTTNRLIDPEDLGKRVYTSGCGKGVMYSSIIELSSRYPLTTNLLVKSKDLIRSMKWLQSSSDLHRTTGGVHTATVSFGGVLPDFSFDDIGRHNAVDKVIGKLLLDKIEARDLLLMVTGRISSEILYKAKQYGIPIIVSRGAPTHQTILLARQMGITIVGFVRSSNFAVYTFPERILA